MNSRFLLLLLVSMVHSGVAFAPCVGVNDLIDSTAFNVAMFAMGWAVTRWMKNTDLPVRLQWCKALVSSPRVVTSLCAAKHGKTTSSCTVGEDPSDIKPDTDLYSATPFLSPNIDDASELVVRLGDLLTRRISSAQVQGIPPWRRSCFHSKQAKDMSLVDYVAHVHWYSECSSPCLVLAFIYLDRALSRDLKVELNWETAHRLFLTSLVVALKFHDDDYVPYPNAHYADVGSVPVKDLNSMEKQLCEAVGWQFHVKFEEYEHYRNLLLESTSRSFSPAKQLQPDR